MIYAASVLQHSSAVQQQGHGDVRPLRRIFLAESVGRIEDHAQVKGRMKAHSGNFIAAFVSAAFLWALALSASPKLHERVHPDANSAEHTCAVTFIASGSYDHSAQAPLITAPVPTVQFSKIPALSPQWVQSPFLGASIFEHAPPAFA
jgi:hypothetical protein